MKSQLIKSTVTLVSLAFFHLTQASNELKFNEELPIMVDSKTELDDILLKDMTVIYTYQLKNIAVDEAFKLKDNNKAFIEHNACNDESIQCLLYKDLDVQFVYKIGDTKILSVDINKELCNQ